MKVLIPVLGILALTACSATASTSAQQESLSYSQGQKICSDLLVWSKVADNEGAPRFTPVLEADEALASSDGSELGPDMAELSQAFEQNNSLAWQLGQPQQVAQLCENSYGVAIPLMAQGG